MSTYFIELMQNTRWIFKKNWLQFSRFLLMGFTNTIIGYSIFMALIYMGNGASVALLLTYGIAVPINYITTGRVVFSNTSLSAFLPFILAYVVIYCINLLLLHLLMHWQMNQLLAQAFLLPLMAALSFLIFKNSVFRKAQE